MESLGSAELDEVSVVVVNDRPVPGGNSADGLEGFCGRRAEGSWWSWASGSGGPRSWRTCFPGPSPNPWIGPTGGEAVWVTWTTTIPVFEIFRGPRIGDFTGARFFRSRDLQVAESETSQVLARYDDGSVALAEKRVGEGRVLVWTSTLDAFWNDLAQQPVFLPFIHQLVRYASGRTEAVSAFTAGQVLDVTDATAMATAGLGEVAEALAGPRRGSP